MNQLLAQAAQSVPVDLVAQIVIALVLALAGGGGGLLLGRTLKTKTEIAQQPLSVELMESIATKAELEKLESKLSKSIAKVELKLDQERDRESKGEGNVHRRIDALSASVGELCGTVEANGKILQQILSNCMNQKC